MYDIVRYFPLFGSFLNQMSDGLIYGVESIKIDELPLTSMIEVSNFSSGFNPIFKTRLVNRKIYLNVYTYGGIRWVDQSKLGKQFLSMFKRQFKNVGIDTDMCCIIIQ